MNWFPDRSTVCLAEVPGEISLSVVLAGCGHVCEGCHSPEYRDRKGGEELTYETFRSLLLKYEGKASCICIFNGEHNPDYLKFLTVMIQNRGFKSALYSGFDFEELPEGLADCFDFVKCGSYREELGGLSEKTTNQRMLKKVDDEFMDITKEFQRSNYV